MDETRERTDKGYKPGDCLGVGKGGMFEVMAWGKVERLVIAAAASLFFHLTPKIVEKLWALQLHNDL